MRYFKILGGGDGIRVGGLLKHRDTHMDTVAV